MSTALVRRVPQRPGYSFRLLAQATGAREFNWKADSIIRASSVGLCWSSLLRKAKPIYSAAQFLTVSVSMCIALIMAC